MAHKKEAKELIEVLLREQRMRRPKGQDPLEGIEGGGLPEELRHKVYRRPEEREPLVDFLVSVEEKSKKAEKEGKRSSKQEKQKGRARPAFYRRLGGWSSHAFAFLNKTCEVRVATLAALAGGAVVAGCLAFLWGLTKGRNEAPALAELRRGGWTAFSPQSERAGSKEEKELPAVRRSKKTGARNKAGSGKVASGGNKRNTADADSQENGGVYTIRVTTVPASARNRRLTRKLCEALRTAGVPRPEVVEIQRGDMLVVVGGSWSEKEKAREAAAEVRSKIRSVAGIEGFPTLEPSDELWIKP